MKTDINSDDENNKFNLKNDNDEEEVVLFSIHNSESFDEKKNKDFFHFTPRTIPRNRRIVTPVVSLINKHQRSFDSSNSSDSNQKAGNKKRKYKQLTSFQQLYINSLKENFQKNFKILKEDFKLLEEYEKKIFKDTNLDIMFIMDLTGSMGTWLNEAKKTVKNIIEEILDNNPGSKIRLSFIGYRDFIEAKQKRIYNSIEFTEDINEFDNFLSKLECYGGGDEPEDIVGALGVALNMNWNSNSKYAVLVCDAPCHGKKYHDISYDKFEEGDPDGTLLEDVMKKFYEKGITFYCIEIDNNTTKMFNIMREVYNNNEKFHVEKLGNSVHQFSFFVAFSASVLLGNAKYKKMKFNEIITNYRNEIISKIMEKYINNKDSITTQLINEIENLNLGDNDKKLLDFIHRMDCLTINNDKNNIKNEKNDVNDDKNYIQIEINEESIKKLDIKDIKYTLRALSYNKNLSSLNDWVNPIIIEKAFKTKLNIEYNTLKKDIISSQYELSLYDKVLEKKKIGKIPFFIHKKYYNNPSLYLKDYCYKELICEQIADYFNIFLEEKFHYKKQFIKFEKNVIYEIDSNKYNESNNSINNKFFSNSKYIISEESIPIELNNNIQVDKRTFQAFSHFSYQITGGELLITNLNYNNDNKKIKDFKIYYLKENGYKNILEFFSSHICDNTCKMIGLIHPRKKNTPIQIDEDFYSKKYLTEVCLCKCCSVPITIRDEKKDKICGFCSCNETLAKYRIVCSECNNPFYFSKYVFNCNLTNYPNKCSKCNSNF